MPVAKRRKVESSPLSDDSFGGFESDSASESARSVNSSDLENASTKKEMLIELRNGTGPVKRHPGTTFASSGRSSKQNVDDERSSPSEQQSRPASIKSFKELGVIDPLCDACEALSFRQPTPVQVEAIPWALQGRDVIGLAETGSGKTAAFALPILQALMEKPQPKFALVLAPTRELAFQTRQQFLALGSTIRVQCAAVVGGVDQVGQAIELARGPHVIVATPGRLLEHLENTKGFNLKSLKYLVMDEADRLLDMNFGKEIDKILKELPTETRKTYLFSATMSSGVSSLQRASLKHPVRVSVSNDSSLASAHSKSKHTLVKSLVQRFLFRPHNYKDLYLLYLLTVPYAGQSTIVFVRTVKDTDRLTYLLRTLGLGAIPLHGQLSQSSRMSALNKFKAHSRDILVATDVAARGLDIPSVDLVLNYDLPGDDTTYVHRVGRTARAGKSGVAVSLVSQYDVEVWLRIEAALDMRVQELSGVEKSEVMVLAERVDEAQKVAIRALKEAELKKGKGVRGKRKQMKDLDERDLDEG